MLKILVAASALSLGTVTAQSGQAENLKTLTTNGLCSVVFGGVVLDGKKNSSYSQLVAATLRSENRLLISPFPELNLDKSCIVLGGVQVNAFTTAMGHVIYSLSYPFSIAGASSMVPNSITGIPKPSLTLNLPSQIVIWNDTYIGETDSETEFTTELVEQTKATFTKFVAAWSASHPKP